MDANWRSLLRDQQLLTQTLRQLRRDGWLWAQQSLQQKPMTTLAMAAVCGFVAARRLPRGMLQPLLMVAGNAVLERFCEHMLANAMQPPSFNDNPKD